MTAPAIPAFRNLLPVDIRFGEGVVAELASIVRSEGARSSFVVFDTVAGTLPDVVSAVAELERSGIEVTRYEKPPGEPTAREADAVSAAIGKSGADLIVAIGGGSVIDVAKAARLARTAQVPYLTVQSDPTLAARSSTLPLIAVPTTAGSGSEVSGGVVITDDATHTKKGVAAPFIRAQYALVDPVLTYLTPLTVTAWSGIDAIAQSIASIVSTSRTPVGNAVGLEAVYRGSRALPAIVTDAANHDARQEMACASLLGGLAMNISDCGSEHSLGQALGGRCGLAHGLTIGLVLAESMDVDRRGAPELFDRIADALGEPADGGGDGSRAVRGISRLLAEIDFPVLRDCGVDESDVEALAEAAMADVFIHLAPVAWTVDDAAKVYRRALALTSRSS